MNPKRNTTVTRDAWNAGSLSGTDIDGHILQPFRIFKSRTRVMSNGHPVTLYLHGQLYGVNVPDSGNWEVDHAKRNELFLLYGYVQRYSRNTCKFVMSRAARRRGYKTSDWWYNNKVMRHAKKDVEVTK